MTTNIRTIFQGVNDRTLSLTDTSVVLAIDAGLASGALDAGDVTRSLLSINSFDVIIAAEILANKEQGDANTEKLAREVNAAIKLGSWNLIDQTLTELCSVDRWKQRVKTILGSIKNGNTDPQHPIIARALVNANSLGLISLEEIRSAEDEYYKQEKTLRKILDRIRSGRLGPHLSFVQAGIEIGIEMGLFTRDELISATRAYHRIKAEELIQEDLEKAIGDAKATNYVIEIAVEEKRPLTRDDISSARRAYQAARKKIERILDRINNGSLNPELRDLTEKLELAVRRGITTRSEVMQANSSYLSHACRKETLRHTPQTTNIPTPTIIRGKLP